MAETKRPKMDVAVTFKKDHRHHNHDYQKDDVGLVTEKAAAKLKRRGLAEAGGNPKDAVNAKQAREFNAE